ncbi:FAD-dependent oxidoreductase [Halopenitus sp. H-Gu1]|uniref:FAD-dependent oxidoreductase n=1 Tax=Halopenitus sp. H-Gu1 TaxID=3242697 RepID=UPI00359EB790
MSDPFVIIGGDAAGLSAASKLKREDPDRETIVLERGKWVSYAHCGMPYYVKGDIGSITKLLSLSPEAISERNIDLRRGHEVTAVDPDARTVRVRTETDQYTLPYGDLLIATGAHAISDPIEGADLEGAFTMHGMDAAAALRAFLTPPEEIDPETVDDEYVDRDRVETYANREPPESVAVIGGGYVGIEMVEAFQAHDLDVHLFHKYDGVLMPFGEAVGDRVNETLREHGVRLHLETEVHEIVGDERVEGVIADDGRTSVDVALVGIGIQPNTEIVEETDIECGDSGAIATDEFGRTNREHVYAAGDCAEMRHAVTGEPAWVPLGLTANRAGRAIGQTVAGDPTPVGDIVGTAAVKAFEMECARTGTIDLERARDAGFDPVRETVTASSRSGYYPGAAETTVTLVADRGTGRLLGGTIVGSDRAAIRIDTLATAIEGGMTVGEMERLDLAYAPPFSPVWDPVLVAAKVLNGSLDD